MTVLNSRGTFLLNQKTLEPTINTALKNCSRLSSTRTHTSTYEPISEEQQTGSKKFAREVSAFRIKH